MLRNDNPRLLLTKIRNADFAHAGDQISIDIVLKKIFQLEEKFNKDFPSTKIKALDVGCGLGGTAAYIKNKTTFNLHGIDIDQKAIRHAQSHYPDIKFSICDVSEVDKFFPEERFDLIYLFNVFYAFSEQKGSLKKLAKIAKEGALVVIFDYTHTDGNKSLELKDLAGKEISPIQIDALKGWLDEAGWELLEITDLTDKYKTWYKEFLYKLEDKKNDLLKEFSEDAFNKVHSTFSVLLNDLNNNKIGGGIIYGRLRHNFFQGNESKTNTINTHLKIKSAL